MSGRFERVDNDVVTDDSVGWVEWVWVGECVATAVLDTLAVEVAGLRDRGAAPGDRAEDLDV